MVLSHKLKDGAYFCYAHTFCASRKHWFKCAHVGFDTDAVNYVIKYMTKIKAKFSYCDQIKFNYNSLYLNQEHQKSSI